MKATSGKAPLVCPKCECFDEYKGEVCLEDGRLQVKYARCKQSRACLERMIDDFTGIQKNESLERKGNRSYKAGASACRTKRWSALFV